MADPQPGIGCRAGVAISQLLSAGAAIPQASKKVARADNTTSEHKASSIAYFGNEPAVCVGMISRGADYGRLVKINQYEV